MALLKNLTSPLFNGVTFIKKLNTNFALKKILRFSSIYGKKLTFARHGEPTQVVEYEGSCFKLPGPDDVLVRMLAAPVNPSDINTIQGLYPIRPPLPAVPGNEGVGKIIQLGSEVQTFKVGDKVVPKVTGLGTWRTHVMCSKHHVRKVNDKLEVLQAATLSVNPCTAFRMLQDFVKLKPNETVIQNGANSAVGQAVIQMCHLWCFKTINIVRNRDNLKELKTFLKELGGTCVFTEEELKSTDVFKSGALPKPRLALNCVGGSLAKAMLRHMDDGGTMVTYGGMSREPLTIPASALIFNNINFIGFWVTKWNKQHDGKPEQESMLETISEMFINDQLKLPVHKLVTLENYKEALENTINKKGFAGIKYIFHLGNEDDDD